ncbi:DUF5990 family protein [Streptomyces lasiicapitis]|uniref:Monooxygenase n=1 Tax=Streptomyces lasiicapitis TaxID=1923961 RepID=A0ABQ2LZK8_9ACTN|nr:DUF5990 family protein [Streptomyces lasiicapitis]GGO44970.1 hypothetical protein GCM10012286_32470 [Streptomyces lasiicapitis]
MTQTLTLRIVGRDLPGAECGGYRDVHVAVQRGAEPDRPVRADAAEVVFEFEVSVVAAADGTPDFKGPYVQGKRGERFFYLTWGELPPGGEFAMFRRAKLWFADVPEAVLTAGVGVGEVGLTDEKGMPLCAGVRPPGVAWGVG